MKFTFNIKANEIINIKEIIRQKVRQNLRYIIKL